MTVDERPELAREVSRGVPEVRETPFTLAATDGYELAATLFEPPADGDLEAVVQIHPATAVRRGLYVKYARFLAGRGFTVLTFDYRGTADSLGGDLRSFEGGMRHWGERDIEGVLRFVADRFPGYRHGCVAHSVAGYRCRLCWSAALACASCSVTGLASIAVLDRWRRGALRFQGPRGSFPSHPKV